MASFRFSLPIILLLLAALSCNIYIPPAHQFYTGGNFEITASPFLVPSISTTFRKKDFIFFAQTETSGFELAFRTGAGAGKIIFEKGEGEIKTLSYFSAGLFFFRHRYFKDGQKYFIDGIDLSFTLNWATTSKIFDFLAGGRALLVLPFTLRPFIDITGEVGGALGYKNFKVFATTGMVFTPLLLSILQIDEYYPPSPAGRFTPLLFWARVGLKLSF